MKVTLRIYDGPGTASELIPIYQRMMAGRTVSPSREHVPPTIPVGLGDLVERLVKPFATEIDSATADFSQFMGQGRKWATKAAHGCSPCSQRRRALNRLVRNVRSWSEWAAVPKKIRAMIHPQPAAT